MSKSQRPSLLEEPEALSVSIMIHEEVREEKEWVETIFFGGSQSYVGKPGALLPQATTHTRSVTWSASAKRNVVVRMTLLPKLMAPKKGHVIDCSGPESNNMSCSYIESEKDLSMDDYQTS